MIQQQDKGACTTVAKLEQTSFNAEVQIDSDVDAINLTEGAMQQSLRELESVWMKHHNHYADVLDGLMLKVNAARGVV